MINTFLKTFSKYHLPRNINVKKFLEYFFFGGGGLNNELQFESLYTKN